MRKIFRDSVHLPQNGFLKPFMLFSFIYSVVDVNFGNEFGHQMMNGSWTGLIGALQKRELDMTNNMIILHNDRREIVDFLRPILREK